MLPFFASFLHVPCGRTLSEESREGRRVWSGPYSKYAKFLELDMRQQQLTMGQQVLGICLS